MDNFRSIYQDFAGYIKSDGLLFVLFIIALLTRLEVYNVYIVDLFCIFAIVKTMGIKGDLFFPLLVFSLLYSSVLFFNGTSYPNFEILGYIIGPCAFYRFGIHVMDSSEDEHQISTLFLIIILFSCIGLYITIFRDIQQFGLINIYRTIGGQGESAVATATLLGLVASVGFAGFSYVLMCENPFRSVKSILYGLFMILSLLAVIHLINRTGIVVLISVIIVVSFYRINGNFNKLIPVILSILIIYIILVQIGVINTEVIDVYKSRNLGEEDAGGANGRFDRWLLAFPRMLDAPLGWSTQTGALYCHSLWFDIARVSGIIPFIAIIYILIIVLKNFFKLFTIRNNTIIGVFIGFNVCMLLSASMEPVLEGASSYFYLMCMIWGMQEEFLNNRLISHLNIIEY